MAAPGSRSRLVRSGTTQAGRDLVELDPAYFRIDERELADFVLYAQALSRELAYYGPDNRQDGDWEAFFASDTVATLAALSRLPLEPFRTALADAEAFLKQGEERPDAELAAYFNLIFHLPVALFGELARAHARLPRDHPLHGRLSRLVTEDLAGPLAELTAYYKGAIGVEGPFGEDELPLDPGPFGAGPPDDGRPRLSETVAAIIFTGEVLTQRRIAGPAAAALGAASWHDFASELDGDATPYPEAEDTYEQIYGALSYNLLSIELERVFQGLERARAEAQTALDRSLTEVDDHAPHYGLFLAFLDLLAVARGDLNGMTARHLDFYYREVLRMAPRAPVPDSVHVLFELAKGTGARRVAAETGLRAGKDDTGVAVEYRLADDIVVNRGTVAALRAVRVHSVEAGGDLHQTVFASPVANSADGLGAELPDGAAGWRPFGPIPYPDGQAEAQAPFGRVGFAVADRRLFLREGVRTMSMTFELGAPPVAFGAAAIRVRLTTPDGWHEVGGTIRIDDSEPMTLHADFSLDGGQPPVVPFVPAMHAEEGGPGYPTGLPVAELTFDFKQATDTVARAFAALREARIQSASLWVSASGLRSLSFLTPDGAGDPSKPFPAFGSRPKTNAPLVIGSSEIFAKSLSALTLRVTWDQVYASDEFFGDRPQSDYACKVSYLSKGAWQAATKTLDLQLDTGSPLLAVPDPSLTDGLAAMSVEPLTYGPAARSGFVRLELGADFGHEAYPAELTRATIELATGSNAMAATAQMRHVMKIEGQIDGDDLTGYTAPTFQDLDPFRWIPETSVSLPKAPYTPVIREVTAEYETTAGPPAQFFHVAPFGQAEREAVNETLLPPLDYEAALFVGVEGFEGPARLALLFQVANGTGDPLLEDPELDFHYLAGDLWTAFAGQDVDDKTGNLAASAVLGLALPEAADTGHVLMPDGLHWLRISAAQNAGAVNSLIAVEAQAARAAFQDLGNDPQFLAAPLPAETISKLVVPDSKIKKIRQPYASFGGRPEESAEAFRRRGAERLRHKDRASTLWDYERLALEAAPELYRVKCLNHTELMRRGGRIFADNELSPGGVVVVTVPWTIGRPHLDPLRPYTDQATLKKVRDVLAARVSPFVRLELANPKFEEVQVKFRVAFREGIDDVAFYLGELEQAVIGHLAPWSVGEGLDITFGGRLRKSSVIDFVEELPYVDYLESFELYHRPDPDAPGWTPADMETVAASTARSILVSAPRHAIAEVA